MNHNHTWYLKIICATPDNYFKLLNIHQKLEWIKNPLIISVSWTAGCISTIANIQIITQKRRNLGSHIGWTQPSFG